MVKLDKRSTLIDQNTKVVSSLNRVYSNEGVSTINMDGKLNSEAYLLNATVTQSPRRKNGQFWSFSWPACSQTTALQRIHSFIVVCWPLAPSCGCEPYMLQGRVPWNVSHCSISTKTWFALAEVDKKREQIKCSLATTVRVRNLSCVQDLLVVFFCLGASTSLLFWYCNFNTNACK
jgi:hypothetical protein